MSTATRTAPFFTINHADAHLRLVHLRRRRAELARGGASPSVRLAVAVALLGARLEVVAFARLAERLEAVPR
jgi:hypothetical protein